MLTKLAILLLLAAAGYLWRRHQNRPRTVLKDYKGSLIQGLDDCWWIAYSVPLVRVFDWLEDSQAIRANQSHLNLFIALFGHEGQIEVLPLPLTREQRIERIISSERPSTQQRLNPLWYSGRYARAAMIADELSAQPGGDVESHGFLFVNLGRTFEPSNLTQMQFMLRPDIDKLHLEHFEHANKISAAEKMRAKLESTWPGLAPAGRELLDQALMQMVWPGHTALGPPLQEEGFLRGNDYLLEYFGQSDYDDTQPYEMCVNFYGRQTYVSCLPIRTAHGTEYLPSADREFGFQAYKGRRVRFTYRFEVRGGKELLTDAGHKLKDVKNHAKSHSDAGGHIEDLKRNVTVAEAFYQHLVNDGIIVRGRPMLVATADTSEELMKMREALRQSVRRSGCTVVDDNQVQRQLLLASFPGSKPFERYIRTIGPKLAAMSMPFVTSAPAITGPDLFGLTMGREILPVFYEIGAALREGATVAPVWCFHGPSRRGKTTALVDWLIPMALRGYVTHLYDLAKFDLALLDQSKLPAGLIVNMVDLLDHPGCLNPVLLTPPVADTVARDELRVSAMFNHLKKMCGRKWEKNWAQALQAACFHVLIATYQANPTIPQDQAIPSLYDVLSRLRSNKGGFKDEGALATCLAQPMSDRAAADITCANTSVRSFIDALAIPGMHVIQQRGIAIPDESIKADEYEPRHDLAMATLDLAGLLSLNVAMARNIPVAIGHVEFHVTSRLSKGSNVADFMARVGAALNTTTLYDTQQATDLAPTLRDQVTGWVGFTPNSSASAKASLEHMGLAPTPRRITDFMGLLDPRWSKKQTPDGVNKGGIFFRPPGAAPTLVAVQNVRWYVGEGFLTDQSERQKQESTHPLNSSDPRVPVTQ